MVGFISRSSILTQAIQLGMLLSSTVFIGVKCKREIGDQSNFDMKLLPSFDLSAVRRASSYAGDKPSSDAGGIADDLKNCADLDDVSEQLAVTIFKLDKYWSTVGDKETKKCVTPCGANAKDEAGHPISIENCCSLGNLLINANFMLNPGYAGTEGAKVNIGNLCTDGPAKAVSAAIKSVQGNVGVFRQLKRLDVPKLASQVGLPFIGALAHIAWFWNACQSAAMVSECWAFGEWGDPVALKLAGAWKTFLGESEFLNGKLGAIEVATNDPYKLRKLASAWKYVDCEGDEVCINGLKTDLDKIQDLKSMGGTLDLSGLNAAVVPAYALNAAVVPA